jgi:LEA14-like dessication related protein
MLLALCTAGGLVYAFRMWQRIRLYFLAVFLLAFTTGCPVKPVAELYGVRVQSVSPAGIQLDMTMKVNNYNIFDVKVRNVRCAVTIAERFRLPPIVYNPDTWLGANASTIVHVPVTMPWTLVWPMINTTVGSNVLGYRTAGVVDITAVRMLGIQVNDYQFDDEGSVSRFELLTAAMRGMGPIPTMR